MPAKFVTARHRGILKRITVPERALKYMPGWEQVPEDQTRPKRRKAPKIPAATPAADPPATDSPSAATTEGEI